MVRKLDPSFKLRARIRGSDLVGAENLIRGCDLGVLSMIASTNAWELVVDSVGNEPGTCSVLPGWSSFVGSPQRQTKTNQPDLTTSCSKRCPSNALRGPQLLRVV